MNVTRRQFVSCLAIAPAVLSPAAAMAAHATAITEWRVYDCAGAIPPSSALRRCGIKLVASNTAGSEVRLTISFPSLQERARAWDRFNSDPEWCALRERREVRLREITITAA